MNILFGTNLSPNQLFTYKTSASGILTQPYVPSLSKESEKLVMHHVVPKVEKVTHGKKAETRFDWRQSGISVSDDFFMPLKPNELAGNTKSTSVIERWVKQWKLASSLLEKGQNERFAQELPSFAFMFVRGPPGTGKHTAVTMMLKKYGYANIKTIHAASMSTDDLVHERLIPMITGGMKSCQEAIIVSEMESAKFTGTENDPLLLLLRSKMEERPRKDGVLVAGLTERITAFKDAALLRRKKHVSECILPCPIVFIATDYHYQSFFKSLEKACGMEANHYPNSTFVLFYPVKNEDVETRYSQICNQWNIFARGKNVKSMENGNLVADWIVLNDMASVSMGDVRKAISTFVCTVRRAYREKQGKIANCSADFMKFELVLHSRHCAALLKIQKTIQSSPLHACAFILHECRTIVEGLNHVSRLQMNAVPDMLFAGFHKIVPMARRLTSEESMKLAAGGNATKQRKRNEMAALIRLDDMADLFCRTDIYRQNFSFVKNDTVQQLYHDIVTTWSFLLLHGEQESEYEFSTGKGSLQKREFCKEFYKCTKKECSCKWMQKSSLDAHRGQRSQWNKVTIAERNNYDISSGNLAQSNPDRYLFFRNYVCSVGQVRSRGKHLKSMLGEKRFADD